MIHPHNGTLFGNKKAEMTDTSNNLDEFQGSVVSKRKHPQKVTSSMISFM